MPTATDSQVPKPLTYTLMYHFLWAMLFWLSALTLGGVFLSAGRTLTTVLLAPLPLVVLALVATVGTLATYVVRVEVLLGNVSRADAFRWSAWSSWSVVIVAPVLFCVWQMGLEALAHQIWGGGASWSVPVEMAVATTKVEVVVWGLSHLLSVRGLTRGRKKYHVGEVAKPALRTA